MKNLIFTIGRYKGATLEEIFDCDKNYVFWFLNNIDIPETEKQKALNEINRIYN